jgi:pimeloyl-ACP methyl ester carboxylesterase
VVIYGPGTPDNKNASAFNVAAAAAARGIALIAINGPGVGFGPASTLTIVPHTGAAVTFSAGGRSVDENGDGLIGSGIAPTSEGDEFLPRGSFIARRDVPRQGAVDMMALVRLMEVGMDVDGDGMRDLDPSRIFYEGWSFGAAQGALLAAVEPNIRVVGLNAAGGGIDSARLSPGNRPAVGRFLGRRVPSALNDPGISAFASIAASAPLFNENMPLRDNLPLNVVLSDGASATIQSPVVNTVAGAMEIQRIIDYTQWALQSSDATAYARHLRASPLDGVPAKSVIMQMNRGDQTVPNTATTAVVRAGNLADRTMYYRHDLAGQVLKNPHTTFILTNDAAMRSTARAEQDQFAILFESEGALFVDPDDYMVPAPSQPLFEAPIVGPLPEDLGFIP